MSLVTEQWELLGRTTDKDGQPVAYVGRKKFSSAERLTVFKLVQRPNGHWYNYGQWLSIGRFRPTDDWRSAQTRPLKLSDSRIDSVLRCYAEQG